MFNGLPSQHCNPTAFVATYDVVKNDKGLARVRHTWTHWGTLGHTKAHWDTLRHTEAHWGRVEVLRHAGATNWSRAGPDASLLLFTLLTFLSTTCFVT